jgi:hypothetical protein
MPGAKGDGLVDGAGEVVNLFGIFVFLATVEAIRDSGTGLWRLGRGACSAGLRRIWCSRRGRCGPRAGCRVQAGMS